MNESALRDFERPGRIGFGRGPGGLTVASLQHEGHRADLALHGAHVLHYQPAGGDDVLWLSGKSQFEAGAPIRGGIPVCWPWFGPHPTDEARPAHGFARLRAWTVVDAQAGADETALALRLRDDPETHRLWPHPFELVLRVALDVRSLRIALVTANTGHEPFRITQALHTYLAVRDVAAVRIHGLDATPYLDKLAQYEVRCQQGPVTILGETDRIYTGTATECVVEDPGWPRRLRVAKGGSRTTVVWNPWIEKARRMPDFGDDEYPRMLCVETANAGPDAMLVPPRGTHTLSAILSAERFA